MIDLINYVPIGVKNAIPSKELAKLINCGSVRELQQYIEVARNRGCVICSSWRGGYYQYDNIHELREYVRTQENRAVNTLKSLQSAKEALQMLENE